MLVFQEDFLVFVAIKIAVAGEVGVFNGYWIEIVVWEEVEVAAVALMMSAMNYSQFLEAIRVDPNSSIARIAFSDFLTEMGDDVFADLVVGVVHSESITMRLWSTSTSQSRSGSGSWLRSGSGSMSRSGSTRKT